MALRRWYTGRGILRKHCLAWLAVRAGYNRPPGYGSGASRHYGASWQLQFGDRDLRTRRHGLEWLRQRKRRPGVQPEDRDLCTWCHHFKRLRHHKRRASLQPENRGVRIHGAEFQCLRQLGGLDCLEERQHCILTAPIERLRNHRLGDNPNGGKAYGASGAI